MLDIGVHCSVVEAHHVVADPNVDPDSTYHPDADPDVDPDSYFCRHLESH